MYSPLIIKAFARQWKTGTDLPNMLKKEDTEQIYLKDLRPRHEDVGHCDMCNLHCVVWKVGGGFPAGRWA